jgi:hypothetical protein
VLVDGSLLVQLANNITEAIAIVENSIFVFINFNFVVNEFPLGKVEAFTLESDYTILY